MALRATVTSQAVEGARAPVQVFSTMEKRAALGPARVETLEELALAPPSLVRKTDWKGPGEMPPAMS